VSTCVGDGDGVGARSAQSDPHPGAARRLHGEPCVSIARTIPLILVTFASAWARDAAPTTPKVATASAPSTRAAPRRVPSQPIQQPASRPPGEPFTLALDPGADSPAPVTEAVAVIAPTKGHHAKGTVRFREVSGGLEVVATIDNLPARTRYHVHVHGDCSSPDAASAGPHSPLHRQLASPARTDHHREPRRAPRRGTHHLGRTRRGFSQRCTGCSRSSGARS
jgi:hypothetical protein